MRHKLCSGKLTNSGRQQGKATERYCCIFHKIGCRAQSRLKGGTRRVRGSKRREIQPGPQNRSRKVRATLPRGCFCSSHSARLDSVLLHAPNSLASPSFSLAYETFSVETRGQRQQNRILVKSNPVAGERAGNSGTGLGLPRRRGDGSPDSICSAANRRPFCDRRRRRHRVLPSRSHSSTESCKHHGPSRSLANLLGILLLVWRLCFCLRSLSRCSRPPNRVSVFFLCLSSFLRRYFPRSFAR